MKFQEIKDGERFEFEGRIFTKIVASQALIIGSTGFHTFRGDTEVKAVDHIKYIKVGACSIPNGVRVFINYRWTVMDREDFYNIFGTVPIKFEEFEIKVTTSCL